MIGWAVPVPATLHQDPRRVGGLRFRVGNFRLVLRVDADVPLGRAGGVAGALVVAESCAEAMKEAMRACSLIVAISSSHLRR